MKFVRLIVLPFLGMVGSSCIAQTTPDMATGLSPYATYIPSEIDNINPANGNIFIKIPLLGYPQKGSRLRLNYYIYYNDKQWQANLAEIFPTYGSPYVQGQWLPAGISQSAPNGGAFSVVPSPAGVYIARDQFLGFGSNYGQTNVQNVGGQGGNAIIESTTYLTQWVYTPDGSVHYVSDGVNESVACGPLVSGGSCPAVPDWGNDNISLNTYPATDGSGYDQNGHDPEGNKYTSSSVTDPNGNAITWSSGGWTDTIGRFIPGSASGAGANEFPNATSGYAAQAFYDLIPGSASGVPSQCPSGTSAGRTWTVPASTSSGGSATYYLCYSYVSFQSAFNTGTNLLPGNQIGSVPESGSTSGLGNALLLTAIILPDSNEYTFQYDSYLSLRQLGLPSGGTISYTWQNIAFRPLPTISTSWSGIATPMSRALASRTLNPGNGQPSITTTYHWNITRNATSTGTNWNQGVSFPAYSIVTDANGNDTEYTIGGTDEYGVTWADYVVTGVATYSGCGPHNTTCSPTNVNPVKLVTYGLTATASGGAPQVSPTYVPLVGTLPPTKVTQETTHLQTSSGSYILSRVKSLLTPRYGTCTVYWYPEYSTPGTQPFPTTQQSSCYATNQVSSTATYDWGVPGSGTVGPLLETETKTFAWEQAYVSSVPSFFTTGATVYPLSTVPNSANMLNLVDTDVMTDGSGSWMAETDYCYDGNGNNTSVQRFPSQPSSHSCSSPPSNALVASTAYSQGVVTSTTEARHYTTTMSNFACDGALPQTITLPDGNQVVNQYDCNTGKVTSVQDQNDINNSVSTKYTYADPLNRVTAASYPDGGSITVNYHGDSLPLTMTVTKATGESAGPNVTTKIYDGLARIIHAQTSDGLPGVSDTIYIDTNYDSLGRTYSVSNPYRSTSEGTYGLTITSYDALSRRIQVTHPDGTSQLFSYNGSAVTFTDESGNQWQRTSDALGRLTQVLEPSSTSQSPTLLTNYTYDTLGNLKTVDQAGISGTESARNRSFAHDGVSRLLAANNPEKASGTSGATLTCPGVSGTWTNCYSYDANGNVQQETDNRGVSIQYSYDSMNRLYGKSYSTGEPAACYQYSTPISSLNDKYPKGNLTLEWTQTSSCPGPSNPQTSIPSGAITSSALAHDPMNRISMEQVCPLGTCSTAYQFNYTYDLAGNLTSSNNGLPSSTSSASLPAISWGETYDAANQLALVSVTNQPWNDSAHPPELFQANQNTYSTFGNVMPYDPFGHLVREQLGLTTSASPSNAGVMMQSSYDARRRLQSESFTGQSSATTVATVSTGNIAISTVSGEQSTTTAGRAATATIGINGNEQSTTFYSCPMQYGGCPVTIYDSGSYSVSVNGIASGGFGWSQGATGATLAASLASAINGNSNSPVTATASGSVVTITSKVTGTGGNYSISVTRSWSSSYFSSPSFTVSAPASMSGGATGGTVSDSGSVTVTINNKNASANWGNGSSANSIVSALASAINATDSSFLTASVSGTVVLLTSNGTGVATNWPIQISNTYDSAHFSSASFSGSASGMTGGTDASGSYATIYSFTLPSPANGYSANGNLLSYTDSVTGNWTYTYDPLNRLQTGAASTGSYAGKYACWAYDSFGNRTAEIIQTSVCPSLETSVPATASYNPNNQFPNGSQYQYDAAGDVLIDPLNSYLYDGDGRLCAVKNYNQAVYQYVYDAEGRRVAKATLSSWPTSCLAPSSAPGFSVQSLYLRGSGGAQVTELSGSGAWVHTNYFGGPGPMATWSSGSWPFAFHINDPLGSRRVLADAQGSVLQTCQNLPYGNGETCTATPTEHLFTGKEHDTESSNDYFEARYYTSIAGRFLSPDWSAKVEPVPYATMGDPQSLNLYAYVRNNPITGFDPDGHMGNADFSQMMMLAMGAQSAAFMEQRAEQAARAQQQSATARREQAAEANAKKNMDKYGPGNNGLTIRPVAGSCGGGNHNCQYELVGNGSEKLYVYEHQTSSVLGGASQGNADYVTPGNGGKANTGIFYDDIGGTNLDTYRFFTVSSSGTYNPSDQHYVPITELGGVHGFEHMYSTGGDVYINGSTNLSPSN